MTDYYARRDYVYSSGNRYFSVPFSYIDKEHIHVFINEEETENFTFLNDSQISITPTLTAGDVVSVRRYTPIDERMVVFSNTSILSKDVQNLDSTQMFNAVQEIYDNNVAFKIDITNQFEDYKDDIDDEISSFETTVTTDVSAIETTANTALSNSQSAVSTANSAETKADNAVSTANTANTNASDAVSTANTALTNSQSAITTANSAVTTANNAVSTADDAVTTATYASDKVDEFGESIEAVIEAAEQIDELQQAIEETQQAAEDAQTAAAQAESAAAELVIDQTFDDTSTHAQSGVAINNELTTNYQTKLVSGTSIKTVNNTSLLGNGNIDTSEIFIATYGTTTFAEIDAAYNAGKAVFCQKVFSTGTYYGYLFTTSSSGHTFERVDSSSLHLDKWYVNTNNVWTSADSYMANKTLSNVLSINSNSAVQTALDTKLNKSGDTMTGNLNFSNSGQSTISLNGIATSSYADITYKDGSSNRLAHLRAYNDSSTKRRVELVVMNDNGSPAGNGVRVTYENGAESCEFPKTKCVDGQWVNCFVQLTTITAIGDYQIDLTNYLPNDGYKYEIMVSGQVFNSNSTYGSVYLNNAHGHDGEHNAARVGTNCRTNCINCTLPVDSGRNIYMKITGHAIAWETYNDWTGLYLVGYRRIGTNS